MNKPIHSENTPIQWWARLILGFVALNAFVGAGILIFLPNQTGTLFFWPINPPINAGLFGALYLGGAVAVAFVVWRNEWESARYLLHCLPGGLRDKAALFHHLRPRLNPGGRVFGTTILGQRVPHNLLAKALMRLYNRQGIFSNRQDDTAGLEQALAAHFDQYQIEIVGCVALFVATARG